MSALCENALADDGSYPSEWMESMIVDARVPFSILYPMYKGKQINAMRLNKE